MTVVIVIMIHNDDTPIYNIYRPIHIYEYYEPVKRNERPVLTKR